MKIFILIFSFVISLSVVCQEDLIGLKHYERKKSFDELFFVGDGYDSKMFEIKFPDSIYEEASIKVKKARFSGVKTNNLQLATEEGVYTYIKMEFRGKKKAQTISKWVSKADNLSKPKMNTKSIHTLDDGTTVEIILLKLPFGKYQLIMKDQDWQQNSMFQ